MLIYISETCVISYSDTQKKKRANLFYSAGKYFVIATAKPSIATFQQQKIVIKHRKKRLNSAFEISSNTYLAEIGKEM